MPYVFASVIVLFLLALAVGGATGQIRARSCCAADPKRDLRMRAAFEDADGATER
jgi:hypothetical protein